MTDDHEWSGDILVSMTRALEAGRVLVKRLTQLTEFVRSLPCECHDEYGKPLSEPCDRCKILGVDGRQTTT